MEGWVPTKSEDGVVFNARRKTLRRVMKCRQSNKRRKGSEVQRCKGKYRLSLRGESRLVGRRRSNLLVQ